MYTSYKYIAKNRGNNHKLLIDNILPPPHTATPTAEIL